MIKGGIGNRLGMLLLAIWLILTGLIAVFGIAIPNSSLILGVLALLAGILILVGR